MPHAQCPQRWLLPREQASTCQLLGTQHITVMNAAEKESGGDAERRHIVFLAEECPRLGMLTAEDVANNKRSCVLWT